MKLALLIANRGFFPSEVIESARSEMMEAARRSGVEFLIPDVSLTKHGAVETYQEGVLFRQFLNQHLNEFDGVVICLPNFGDENGIKAALADVRVPVLLQAYPDEIGLMDFSHRRDAFCGKLALSSVFKQMSFRFTSGMPFTMHPLSDHFKKELDNFVSTCRIVKKMKGLRIGVFGARTSAFKSVRYDEIALERFGIDVETLDLSYILERLSAIEKTDKNVTKWREKLHHTADFQNVPEEAEFTIARLGVLFDQLINEMSLDAVAIRCWSELQKEIQITPCSVMGVFNQFGIPFACETDVTNAAAMAALTAGTDKPVGCLDLNNNYGEEENKCILFHCGPLPLDLMVGPGEIQEHKMFTKTMGENCSWGLNVSRIKPGKITLISMRTENGHIEYYCENALISEEKVEDAFFGVSGVMVLDDLQRKLMNMSKAGFRHHTIIASGHHSEPVCEALSNYLGYDRVLL